VFGSGDRVDTLNAIGDEDEYKKLFSVDVEAEADSDEEEKDEAVMDVEAAFADVPVGESGPAQLSQEAQQRIKLMAERLAAYRQNLQKAVRRSKKKDKEIGDLKEEVQQLESMLERAAQGQQGARGLQMLKLGALPAKTATDDAARQDKLRQLYQGVEILDDEEQFHQVDDVQTWLRRLARRMQLWVRQRMPLQADMRMIEARYGSSVASYFFFARWVILNYILLMVVCGVFLGVHVVDLGTRASSTWSTPIPVGYFWTTANWDTFVGVLPRFLLISSYDPGTSGAATSTFDTGERLAYIALIIVCTSLLTLSAIRKWLREDRRVKAIDMFEAQAGENKYAKLALNAWDHSISKPKEVEDLKFAIAEQFVVALHEEDLKKQKQKRTRRERINLLLRRILGNILYLSVQALAGAAILWLTATSAQLSASIEKQASWLGSLTSSIVPAAVSLINAALPTIILRITKIEKWDDGGTHIKLALTRLFIAKLFNVLVQAFSFAQLADPFILRSSTYFSVDLQEYRTSVQRPFSPLSTFASGSNSWSGDRQCRMDQVANGLFVLIATEFVMNKLLGIGFPLMKMGAARARKKPYKRAEFNVSSMMVNLLYFQQLAMVTFPYFPYSVFFVLVFILINFKFDKWRLQRFMQKPLKPWSAKDSGSFFIKFYLTSTLVMVASTVFFLSSRTFPKECSSYIDLYSAKYSTSTITFDGLEERTFWASTTSTSSITNYGYQALLATEAITTNTTDRTAIATALISYLQLNISTPDAVDLVFMCPFACGPFIYSTNAYEPLESFFTSTSFLSSAYSLTVSNSTVMFGIALALFIVFRFRTNTLRVMQQLNVEKEVAMRSMIDSLERKVRKMEKQISLHKEKRL